MQSVTRCTGMRLVIIGCCVLLFTFLLREAILRESISLYFLPPSMIAVCLFYLNPILSFWTLLYGTMLGGVVVSYVPGMYNIRWGFNLLAILLGTNILFRIIFHHKSARLRFDKVFFLYNVFFLYAVVFTLINGIQVNQLIIALKNNFQFYSFLLFFFACPLKSQFSLRLAKSVLSIALFQPPLALYQYLFIVPQIQYRSAVNSVAVLDAVSGSFGTSYLGGGTGVLTLFICVVLCGLLAGYSRKLISTKKWLFLSLYIMSPLFLCETKVAFIFFLVGGMVVMGLDRGAIVLKKILFGLFILLFSLSMVWGTLKMTSFYGKSVENTIRETIAYNFGERGYGKYTLNRFTCLTFWWQENKDTPLVLFIGHGLDATVEGEVGLSAPGIVAQQYPVYGTGLTTASQMLWETGLVGFMIFLTIFILSLKECIRLTKLKRISNQDFFLVLCTAAGISMSIVLFFFNSSYRTSQPANMLIILLLGVSIGLKFKNIKMAAKGSL